MMKRITKVSLENKLKLLFDFQKYAQNEQLQNLIETIDAGDELDDTDMNLNAAGDILANKRGDSTRG
ncbi:MAG: hypothetical protein RRX92_06695 [Lachnospiraceae bacterium]